VEFKLQRHGILGMCISRYGVGCDGRSSCNAWVLNVDLNPLASRLPGIAVDTMGVKALSIVELQTLVHPLGVVVWGISREFWTRSINAPERS
jgi:hypothetical protein